MNSPTVYGYNFVYQPGIADTTGGAGAAGAVKLWGPGDGSANGLDGVIPGGGNYVAADGVYQAAAITQTITGLTVGRQYDLTFYYAGAQQSGFTGLNTEWWTVSLGSQSDTTPILDNANHGFTGWYEENFLYTATSSSEVLSFMAGGTPGGEPPFTLLTDVALVATPEPGTIGLVGLGLSAGLGLMLFSRRKALGKV